MLFRLDLNAYQSHNVMAGFLQGFVRKYIGFMKRFLAILSVYFLFGLSLPLGAADVKDASFRVIAHISADGVIQDAQYRRIGLFKSDGSIQDAQYRTVGYIKADGTIQDAQFRVIGIVKEDGTVQDARYRTVGIIKRDGTVQDDRYRTVGYAKGLPPRWVAYYFFFRSL